MTSSQNESVTTFIRCANVALETVNKIFYLLDNVPFLKIDSNQDLRVLLFLKVLTNDMLVY